MIHPIFKFGGFCLANNYLFFIGRHNANDQFTVKILFYSGYGVPLCNELPIEPVKVNWVKVVFNILQFLINDMGLPIFCYRLDYSVLDI